MPYRSNSFWLTLILLTTSFVSHAQLNDRVSPITGDTLIQREKDYKELFEVSLQGQGIISSKKTVPFWMRANQFGSIPLSGYSMGWVGRVAKLYKPRQNTLFDWSAAVETRLNVGSTSQVILIEGYAKARLGIFEFKGGRSKDIMGITDSTLSSGAFAVSGNSLGIPKVQIAIPEFFTIPVLGDLLSFKGNFAFGWFGNTPLNPLFGAGGHGNNQPLVSSYYHQKSLYGRFGKPNWNFKFYAGFNHQTMYGNENQIYNNFNLTKLESFYHVVSGKTWVASDGYRTKLGNQLGSIDAGITYDFKGLSLFIYRQQIYDVGALAHLGNVRDNLTGISLKNKSVKESGWKKIVFEFLFTKNQAGESWSKFTPSGDEAYYNNSTYAQGWSYNGLAIGNPFLTPRHEARSNLRYKKTEYFVNNRVILLHSAFEGKIKDVNIKLKLSFSQNYGTYGTSPLGSSLGSKRSPLAPPYFEKVNQFSGYFEGNKRLKNNWQLGIATAYDNGKLLYNSFGMFVSLKKTLRF